MRNFIKTSDLITRANTFINSVGNRVGSPTWIEYINVAVRELRSNRNLPQAKKSYSFDVFSDVYKYKLLEDFDAVISSTNLPNIKGKLPYFSSEKEFKKNYDITLALGWENGEKMLLVKGSSTKDNCLEEFDSVVDEYTLSGDAQNKVSDSGNYRSGAASLKFDIVNNTGASLIEKTIDSLDISDVVSLSTAFIDVFMPSKLDGVKLRFGNNSSNYYETSLISKQYSDTDFVANDWNILGSNSFTEIGSVDLTNITYIAVYLANAQSVNGCRIDGLYLRQGSAREFSYNSTFIVKKSDSEDVWQSDVDDVNNLILWEKDYIDLPLYKALEKAGFFAYRDNELVQASSSFYNNLTKMFEARYPSQEEHLRASYYKRVNRF